MRIPASTLSYDNFEFQYPSIGSTDSFSWHRYAIWWTKNNNESWYEPDSDAQIIRKRLKTCGKLKCIQRGAENEGWRYAGDEDGVEGKVVESIKISFQSLPYFLILNFCARLARLLFCVHFSFRSIVQSSSCFCYVTTGIKLKDFFGFAVPVGGKDDEWRVSSRVYVVKWWNQIVVSSRRENLFRVDSTWVHIFRCCSDEQ